MLKKWLGNRAREAEREYTVDELVILERYDDAELRLRAKMKVKDEIHDHLKLAEICVAQRQVQKAVDEFVYVAEEYARDGFHEKAVAILSKAIKLNPMDEDLPRKLVRIESGKRLEQSRIQALDGMRLGQAAGRNKMSSIVEFQSLWKGLSPTRLVRTFSNEQLRLLFSGVEVVYLDPGQILVDEGEEREELFIVAFGELEVRAKKQPANTAALRAFGPGQIIGEAVLFERRRWPATYRSPGKSALLGLTRGGLEQCLIGNPDPRGFLATLRGDNNDREVINLVTRL